VYGYTLSLVVTSNTLLVLTSHFHSHARNAVGALADDEARDRGACSTHSLLAFSARHRLGLSPPSLVVPSSSFVSPHTLGSEPAKTSVVQEGVSYHNAQPTTITVLAVMRAPQRNHTAILLHQPHSYPRGWLVERACLRAHCHVLLERSLLVVPHRTARGHVAARRFISLHCSGQCPPPLSAEQA
jgi:hypothetical protein